MTDKPQNNRFNTWDYVREERERIESKDDPACEALEAKWQLIQEDYGDRGDQIAETPINAFLFSVGMGFYPPPEVMLSICSCFEHYLHKRGEIELEDVFFNKRQRGVGNYAAKVEAGSLKRHVWMLEQMEYLPSLRSKNTAPKSITDLADEAYKIFGVDDN